jgi:hypothetical protein
MKRSKTMEFLKEVFGDKPITFDDFSKAVTDKGLNIADLSSGAYVGKDKFQAEVSKAKGEFTDLKKKYDELAGAVDGDAGLKKQLETIKTEKEEFEGKFNKTNGELTHYKNSQVVLKAGVLPEMSEFVTYEAQKLTNETIDFDTALKGYIAKNPQFKTTEGKTKVRTAPAMGGGDTDNNNSTNAKMNTALLQAVGRK